MRQLAASFHLIMSSVTKEKTKQGKNTEKENPHARQATRGKRPRGPTRKERKTTTEKKGRRSSQSFFQCVPPSSRNFGNRSQAIGHVEVEVEVVGYGL